MNKLILIVVLCCMTMCHSAPTSDRLVEGDIMLPKGMRSVASNSQLDRWTGGVVPYIIDTYSYSSDQLKTISEAMAMITDKTSGCIQFVPKTSAHANWTRIRSLDGCWSYIGMIGGQQELSLSLGCVYKGTIVHELMHALGFYHEQNRIDRDSYVKISFENIQTGLESNFNKYSAGFLFNTAYDYKSIMHYDELAFSKNRDKGWQTITPIGTGAGIDLIPSYNKTDAQILTASDIQAVRDRYQCGGSVASSTATPSTAAPTTVAQSTSAPKCFNADSRCTYYYNNRDEYCNATKAYSLPSSSEKFSDSCRKMCGLCTVGPCADEWYCPQYTSDKCEVSNLYVLGVLFTKGCPVLCNTCNS